MTKTDTMKADISANAAFTATQREICLKRHKPECKGLLKRPTRTEMPKVGENKMSFTNYHKQMKAPYVVYADFECVLRKISSREPKLYSENREA